MPFLGQQAAPEVLAHATHLLTAACEYFRTKYDSSVQMAHISPVSLQYTCRYEGSLIRINSISIDRIVLSG